MSKKTQSGSVLARILGSTLFGALSSALSTEQFNEAESKVAAELKDKPETPGDEDPLKQVAAATAALGTPAPATPAAVTETATVTAGHASPAAFQAEQTRANKAEEQVKALTTERDTYKAYFEKHNGQGKTLPGADATTTDQAKERTAGQLSDASAQALEYFKGLHS